nr:hypothetical protein [Cytophagales bacterium]
MSTTKWIIDPTHSEVSFKVKHLVISTVTGYFRSFEGSASSPSEDNFDGATIEFSADIDSIDTNQKDRDAHLKSADFFDAATNPKLTFANGILEKKGDDYVLKGDLTMRETTLPVTMDVELGGVAGDPYGNTKAGFEIQGKVSRKAYGLTWSAVTEAGSVVVGDEVKIIASIQLVKQ